MATKPQQGATQAAADSSGARVFKPVLLLVLLLPVAALMALASGRRAYQKASPLETAAATIAEEPPPLATLRPDASTVSCSSYLSAPACCMRRRPSSPLVKNGSVAGSMAPSSDNVATNDDT